MDNSLISAVITAEKEDKKAIKRFYKQQRYSASFIGFDHCYFIKSSDTIVASVIVSFIESNNQQAFLHALVVDRKFQKKGLATQLINAIDCGYSSITCFSNSNMTIFYQNFDFQIAGSSLIKPIIEKRFRQYKQKNPKLLRFIKFNICL
ncbi:MAG: GNAT family N-acetyltransferase [Colwellia sp.]|nr:GNAT family N-acetyltransferase [Colwellia sp.]